ncbi:hypothetical protein B7494_g6898 [Chlorociboria aeruginascens]|nr:hypothetical protein B7494_g6898 [Chlorociboria aeruginascens]
MDMPGYGKGAKAEWGAEVLKYLEHRTQLKRTFLLIDSLHGLKDTDRVILKSLKNLRVPFQVIMSKVDKVILHKPPKHQAMATNFAQLRQLMEQVKEVIQPSSEDDGGAIGEVIACSEYTAGGRRTRGPKMGIDAARFAILRAAGLEYRPKIDLSAPVEIVSHEELFEIQRNKG